MDIINEDRKPGIRADAIQMYIYIFLNSPKNTFLIFIMYYIYIVCIYEFLNGV
jgi:hypothetical protein